jgi:hypothetical protein
VATSTAAQQGVEGSVGVEEGAKEEKEKGQEGKEEKEVLM